MIKTDKKEYDRKAERKLVVQKKKKLYIRLVVQQPDKEGATLSFFALILFCIKKTLYIFRCWGIFIPSSTIWPRIQSSLEQLQCSPRRYFLMVVGVLAKISPLSPSSPSSPLQSLIRRTNEILFCKTCLATLLFFMNGFIIQLVCRS